MLIVNYIKYLIKTHDECEQILRYGDLDLQRNKEHLKAIRRGEVSEKDIRKWASDKEKQLEMLYNSDKCSIPYSPDENKIKNLLLACLEHHYGNLSNVVVVPSKFEIILKEIIETIRKYQLI